MVRVRGFKMVGKDFFKGSTNGFEPVRATRKSMGYDFVSPVDITIEPNKIGKIWTNVKAYMQEDECLILNVRSSMGGKFMLANTQGWVDSDYYSNENNDGNIGIFLKNISDEPIEIKFGDRVAQGVFMKYLVVDDDAPLSDERIGGFGSSGK